VWLFVSKGGADPQMVLIPCASTDLDLDLHGGTFSQTVRPVTGPCQSTINRQC
jgi:hypothetical protein